MGFRVRFARVRMVQRAWTLKLAWALQEGGGLEFAAGVEMHRAKPGTPASVFLLDGESDLKKIVATATDLNPTAAWKLDWPHSGTM